MQTLNLRLPLVDPSHYIARFAALLEFGDETPKVATDAVRLVQRFDRDWMTKGRRPAGICGACLLLAARMNNFRRSMQEIVQVVKIADTTLKKRLDEFRKTPSGGLTLADFRTVWLDEEMDPPAFTKGKEKEAMEMAGEDSEGGEGSRKKKGKGKRKKKKRKRDEEDEPPPEEMENHGASTSALESQPPPQSINPSLLNEGILEGTTLVSEPLFFPDNHDPEMYVDKGENDNIDPALLAESGPSPVQTKPRYGETDKDKGRGKDTLLSLSPLPVSPIEETANALLLDEVNDYLTNSQGSTLVGALDDAEQRRQAQFAVVDELMGLDEDELDRFILTEDEVKIKERVWVEINKEYLEAIAGK